MPTQLEYGSRRAACVREIQKRMYNGHFHYFTGPKSYYPEKVIHSTPPPTIEVISLTAEIENLSLEDKSQLREFSSIFGKTVRQHTVRNKSKEDTGHLPYAISFGLQSREPGQRKIATFVCEDPATTVQETTSSNHEVLFSENQVIAVRHARRREQFSFFLALLKKDLVVKSATSRDLEFTDATMDIVWLDNSDSDDILTYHESYRDNKNSPYSIVDKVDVEREVVHG